MAVFLWHEHPSFKNLFNAEIGLLKRGLGGEFELIKLLDPSKNNGRVIVIGNLSFDKERKQSLKIEFPTKYPYAPPAVISVNLSFNPEGELIENGGILPFNIGKGNQYSNCALCLFPKEMWDNTQHNIGWVLRRAQKWLVSAYSKGGFKKEEVVEEFLAPFPHSGQVLLPKKINLPPNANKGQLVLRQFKPNNYLLYQNVLTDFPFSLHMDDQNFTWYRFKRNTKLKTLIPVLDPNIFLNIFKVHFSENLLEGNLIKNIGLYLPGDDNPWHFFRITIQSNSGKINMQIRYYISRNISEELYLRTKDIFDDKLLFKKRVTIIGLGALGSEVARTLANNGIGHFNLFDIDTFEIGNSIRHAADLFYIGEDKVNVVKQLIQRSNPNITVNTYKVDVLNDSGVLEQCLSESDLCLVLTGEESVDYLINDHYISKYKIPFIFARVSSGGVSGSIQIVDDKSACLRCLSKKGLDKLPKPHKKVKFKELKSEYGSCSSPAVPGSEIDTKEIALQAARISIQNLLGNKSSVYPKLKHKQYFWHGPFGSEKEAPFAWEMRNYKKSVNCKKCR